MTVIRRAIAPQEIDERTAVSAQFHIRDSVFCSTNLDGKGPDKVLNQSLPKVVYRALEAC